MYRKITFIFILNTWVYPWIRRNIEKFNIDDSLTVIWRAKDPLIKRYSNTLQVKLHAFPVFRRAKNLQTRRLGNFHDRFDKIKRIIFTQKHTYNVERENGRFDKKNVNASISMDQPGCFYPCQFCISTREKCNPWERCVENRLYTRGTPFHTRDWMLIEQQLVHRKIKLYIASNFNIRGS